MSDLIKEAASSKAIDIKYSSSYDRLEMDCNGSLTLFNVEVDDFISENEDFVTRVIEEELINVDTLLTRHALSDILDCLNIDDVIQYVESQGYIVTEEQEEVDD